MNIVVFESEEWERSSFQKLGTAHQVAFSKEPLTAQNARRYADAQIISTFIYSELNGEMLRRLPDLRLIATRSTGFDHIDLDYCRQKGIRVANVPAYADHTVAEHVFALLLAISRKIPQSVERTRRGDFSQEGLQGFDLEGKVLGVVGTGRIGRAVIEIARGFRMPVLAYDIHPDETAAIKLGFRYTSLSEVLRASDIISLHVPGTVQTRNLISNEAFAQMKDGVVIINTARGDVIDIQALLQALVSKKVGAAGLDVLPEEPAVREELELLRSIFVKKHNLETLLADQMLHHLPNVIITPHSAFNTREAVQRLLDTTMENMLAFIAGRAQNIVV